MPVADHDVTVAVVVAYNRRDLLLESVEAILAQTVAPDAVIVVDNASDDGSADALAERHPEVDIVRLERNTGGAGGFTIGIALALQRGSARWVWLMDDDTVPKPTALEALLAGVDGREDVALASSRVVWQDGRDHPMNTPRPKPFARVAEREAAVVGGTVPIRSSSFVSMLVRTDRVRQTGLPIADYFLWNDDFEFSARTIRGARAVYVPASVVVHKTKRRADTDVDPGDRFFNEVRNKTWLFLRSRGLNPGEKVLYFGATLRRWARTIVRSKRKRMMLGYLGRGLVAGVTRPPRTNDQVLAGLGRASEAVAAAGGTAR